MRRSQRNSAITAWMLAASILLYPFVTYLATPTVTASRDGHWTLLCTLKGLTTRYVENKPVSGAQAGQDEDCPALKLVQLAGSSPLPEPAATPVARHYLLGPIERPGVYTYHPLHTSVFSCRGPPIA